MALNGTTGMHSIKVQNSNQCYYQVWSIIVYWKSFLLIRLYWMNIQYKNKLRYYLYPTPLISWNMSLRCISFALTHHLLLLYSCRSGLAIVLVIFILLLLAPEQCTKASSHIASLHVTAVIVSSFTWKFETVLIMLDYRKMEAEWLRAQKMSSAQHSAHWSEKPICSSLRQLCTVSHP